MSKLVSDGDKRFVAANKAALQRLYELRAAEIRGKYRVSAETGVLSRLARHLAMQWELARAKREVYGIDKLFLVEAH